MTTEVRAEVQTVDFHGYKLATFEAKGERWVSLRPVVDAMGMSWPRQSARLTADGGRFNCCHMASVGADGKKRAMVCVPLRKYPAWLNSINPNKIRHPHVRERVILFQDLSTEALYQFWFNGAATMESVTEAVREQTPSVDLTPVLQTLKQEQVHTRNSFWCGFNKNVTPRFGKVEGMVVTLTRWLAGRLRTLWEGIDELQIQNAEIRAELQEVQQELTRMGQGVEMMAHQMAEQNRTNARLAEAVLRMTVEGR